MKVKRVCVAAVVALSLTACGESSTDSADDCSVEIFAASSLSSALTAMTDELRTESGCDITYKFGSSGSLAASIEAGATPDLFLSSGTTSVTASGLDVKTSRAIVESSLAIITSKGSVASREVIAVDDLLEKKWKLGLCAATAPCGELADEVLANAGDVFGNTFDFGRNALADTEAINASDLLTKVEMGELDVVLGYASSCASSSDLVCTVIPDEENGQQLGEKTTYFVTPINDSSQVTRLLTFMTSAKFSERLVTDFGFEAMVK
ncbi:MAG: substrate-binding domain-containing protein [Ilumatobacteraceae bacterium]|nr:substrate-binding domain-containing protein [Ilumatobacteraceae bacterium]